MDYEVLPKETKVELLNDYCGMRNCSSECLLHSEDCRFEMQSELVLNQYLDKIYMRTRESTQSDIVTIRQPVHKDVRRTLYEDDNCLLEHRQNRYYLSLYSDDGSFLREVTINVKPDGKVSIGQTT